MPSKRRVVITGLGPASPIGLGVEPFWDALVERRCGLGTIESFDASGMPSSLGGELPAFKLADYIPKTYRKSVKVMSRDIEIAVLCAYEAVKDAGLITKCMIDRGEAEGSPNLDPDRFGANIGAGLICADLAELAGALATAADENGRFDYQKWGAVGMTNLTPLWLLKFLPNMLACHVTIVHDAHAPSNTITCGEASSHLAIGEAFRTISRGDADVCICGGAESKMNPMALARQHLMGYLTSDHSGDASRACRPFGAGRSGTVATEGGGLVILETLEHAQGRGARIYAEIVGFAASTNCAHWAKPDADGQGVRIAIRRAMEDAETDPGKVDLMAPMGLGTVEHDAAAMAAWNAVFADRMGDVHAISTAGALGNNGAGSGAVEFAATVVALHRNTVPPSICTDELDPHCRFRFVQGDPIDAEINEAISVGSALGGGQNAAIIIRKYRE
jgi:3-oxoacyl-[acyl-carrier-protein] synthase II